MVVPNHTKKQHGNQPDQHPAPPPDGNDITTAKAPSGEPSQHEADHPHDPGLPDADAPQSADPVPGDTRTQGSPAIPQPVDALDTWDAEQVEVGSTSHTLSPVRIDGNERLLIPFTTTMARVPLHYLDYDSARGYWQCAGEGCLLCRIGRNVDHRDLLPVYDVIDRVVGVLPISPNIRPQALRPQLAPILRRLRDGGERVIIAIRRISAGQFAVNEIKLPEGADDGAATIRSFLQRIDAGEVDLASTYPQASTSDLIQIPEIATVAKLRGIDPA